MSSIRRREGYFMLDHSASPGLPDEMLRTAGLPADAGKTLFEAATYTCSHCNYVVVVNPDRRRERAYCAKCDHLICDACNATRLASGGECKTMLQLIEEIQEKAAKDEQLRGVSASGTPAVLLHSTADAVPEPLPNGRRS